MKKSKLSRLIRVDVALTALFFLGLVLMTSHAMSLRSRINRAVEILSGDNDEVVTPAKLYMILSGDTFRPVQARDLTQDDLRKRDEKALAEMENGGVPERE